MGRDGVHHEERREVESSGFDFDKIAYERCINEGFTALHLNWVRRRFHQAYDKHREEEIYGQKSIAAIEEVILRKLFVSERTVCRPWSIHIR